jgi:two-component system, response regulator YesN
VIRVLIVDDEELERRALKIILTRHYGSEINVREAKNVEDALTHAASSRPDLVFLDIKMPGSNGLRAARILKTRFSGIKVVILTAHAEFEYAHLAIKFHVDDYLLKPVRPEKILSILDGILGQESKPESDTSGNMQDLEKFLLSGNYQQSRYLFQKSVSSLDERLDICKDWAVSMLHLLEKTCRVYHIESVDAMNSVMDGIKTEREFTGVVERVRNCMEQIFEDIITSKLAMLGSKLDYAVEYIEKNLHRDITLGEVARYMNTSPHYFSRLFKKEFSQSFTDFVTDRRIVRAVTWLRDTDKTITEMAFALGYSEANYFSKVFRKRLGLPPSEFKRLGKDEALNLLSVNLNTSHLSFLS